MGDLYSYPKAFGGFMVGDKVRFPRGRTVYTILQILVRDRDQRVYGELQSDKVKRFSELGRCKKVDR